MLTLWDLLPEKKQPAPPAPGRARAAAPRAPSAAERYEAMEREMLRLYGVRVRKWRSGTTGVAWQVFYRDGSVSRLIESPRPRGPVSASVFLHEIGHHAIGFDRYKVRCVEEYHAWCFALAEMERLGIPITARVRARVRDSLLYALDKARRRGLRAVPPEVAACIAEQDRLVKAEARPARRAATPRPRTSRR